MGRTCWRFGLGILAWALSLWGCAREVRPANPDIAFITLDTTRADRLGCYGCSLAATPVLDEFAGRATRFAYACAPTGATLPSHATMLTGLTQLEHGVYRNATFHLKDEYQTLPEMLAPRGYEAAAFISSISLDERFGTDQGFSPYRVPENTRTGEEVTDLALAWLDARAGAAPLMLWVHYWDPHDPYEPLEPFASATRGSPYDAELSYMDHHLGRLLAGLRARGLFEDAHVIIAGDHGEGLYEHGERYHGLLLYDTTIHVPLLWKLPGQTQGRVVADGVALADITPTLVELLDLAEPGPFAGRSLVPALERGRPLARAGVYTGSLIPYLTYEWSPLHAWQTEDWKYIEGPEPELYHRPSDPREERNRVTEDRAVAAAMAAALADYLRVHDRHERFVAAKEVDESLREQMGSLGYITHEDDPDEGPPGGRCFPNPMRCVYHETLFEALRTAMRGQAWEDAQAAADRILAVMPNQTQALGSKGQALLFAGHPKRAIPLLERHRELCPQDWETWRALARARFELGEYASAAGLYEQIPFGGEDMVTLRRRVGALAAAGRFDSARQTIERGRLAFASLGAETVWHQLDEAVDAVEGHGFTRLAATPGARERQVRALTRLAMRPETVRLLERWAAADPGSLEPGLRDSLLATPKKPGRSKRRAPPE